MGKPLRRVLKNQATKRKDNMKKVKRIAIIGLVVLGLFNNASADDGPTSSFPFARTSTCKLYYERECSSVNQASSNYNICRDEILTSSPGTIQDTDQGQLPIYNCAADLNFDTFTKCKVYYAAANSTLGLAMSLRDACYQTQRALGIRK